MFKRITVLILCALFVFGTVTLAAENQVIYYVSEKSETGGNGSFERPFKTLEEARNAVKKLKNRTGYPTNGVCIYIREGNYEPLSLTGADSGADNAPVTYSAYNGEKVVISGGGKLNFSDFKISSDERIRSEAKGKIYEYDLKENGISDYGSLGVTGHSQYYLSIWGWAPIEAGTANPTVLFDGEQMTLARYPNNGYMNISRVYEYGSVSDKNENPAAQMVGMKFSLNDDRVSSWANAAEPWIFGLWKYDWSDMTTPIVNIDKNLKTIETKYASPFSVDSGRPVYVYNLLEELDVPGEWFYDKNNGKIYIYPTNENKNAEIRLGFKNQTLLNISGAKNIVIDGISFIASRGSGVAITECENVKLVNCEVSNVSGNGIHVDNKNNTVSNCEVYNIGQRGIAVYGGSLTDFSGNIVSNNTVHDVGRFVKMLTPGIYISSVGAEIKNNTVYDCPQIGIIFSGNFNLIEGNNIHDVMLESTDGGAIYAGQRYEHWGNILRKNIISDIRYKSGGAYGIYLDDCLSGTKIEGNIISNIGGSGIFNHGGRSNEIIGNTIKNAAAGISYTGFMGSADPRTVWDFVDESAINDPVRRELLGERFYNIPNDDPVEPKYGIVKDNICVNVDEPLGISPGYRDITMRWIYENNELKIPETYYFKEDFESADIGTAAEKFGFSAENEAAVGVGKNDSKAMISDGGNIEFYPEIQDGITEIALNVSGGGISLCDSGGEIVSADLSGEEYSEIKYVIDTVGGYVDFYMGGELKKSIGNNTSKNLTIKSTAKEIDNIYVKKIIGQSVAEVFPKNNAKISMTGKISVKFQYAVNVKNIADCITIMENGTEIPVHTVSLQNDGKTINIKAKLKPNSNYNVIISKNTGSLSVDENMGKDYVFNFKTTEQNILYRENFEDFGDEKMPSAAELGFVSNNSGLYAEIGKKDGNTAIKMTSEALSEASFVNENIGSISYPKNVPIEITYDVYFENRTRCLQHFAALMAGIWVNNTSYGETFYYHNSWNNYHCIPNGSWYNIKYRIDPKEGEITYYVNNSEIWKRSGAVGVPEWLTLATTNIKNPLNCPAYTEGAEPLVIWFDNFEISAESIELKIKDENGGDVESLADKNGRILKAEVLFPNSMKDEYFSIIAVKNSKGQLQKIYKARSNEKIDVSIPEQNNEKYVIEVYAFKDLTDINPGAEKIVFE